jgi:methyl-accepting chemotaxis protein
VIKPPPITFLLNQDVFVPGDILVAYGKGFENDSLIIRLFDPAGKAVRIESISADGDGVFTEQIYAWPQPSRNLVYGKYTIELASSLAPSYNETRTVTFSDTPSTNPTASTNPLVVKLDSPTQVSVGQTFRIFVQVTYDSALVNVDEPDAVLSSSHIHSGNTTINLAGMFHRQHEGIYYSDVTLDQPGSYVIHAAAFHRGYLAHDTRVISSGSSISEIQETVNALRQDLEHTNQELADTRQAVDDARTSIDDDIGTVGDAVDQLQGASGQINALILPILALISIIIALQISLFARIRASFK